MYYPYLRGKQFELIALKELSDLMSLKNDKISPIIEPIKITSTLKNTLNSFKEKNINFTIIINPQVGDLKNNSNKILEIVKSELSNYSNYQIGIIFEKTFKLDDLLIEIKNTNTQNNGISLIHNTVISEENLLSIKERCGKIFTITNNIINFDKTNSNRRYNRYFSKDTLVSLADYFSSQTKNSDYLGIEESVFTEEHLFYRQEGYKGFGDFLTIGDNYSESGFMPYAVAIHISYADANKKINVRHFVSDSNGDTSDIGGKFAEANEKLVNWCNKNHIKSSAIQQFIDLKESGHFPGLGVIKKLSIINHIELILNSI
jgi:hypothetical protein